MYSVTFKRTNQSVPASNPGCRGYYLTELILSALLIAATAVLAFPTYQDFQPHIDLVDENSVGQIINADGVPGEVSNAQASANQSGDLVPGSQDREEDVITAGLESDEH